MVSSSCHRDVEEPEPLGRFVAEILDPGVGVPRGLDQRPSCRGADSDLGTLGAPQHLGEMVGRDRVQTGEDHDGKLEALRAVHGEDPNRRVVRLGGHGLVDTRIFFGLALSPLDEATQAGLAGVLPSPGLVEEEADPSPVIPGAAVTTRELEEATLPDNSFDRSAHAAPPAFMPVAAQGHQPRGDGIVVGAPGWGIAAEVPAATGLDVLEELGVAAPKCG